MIFEGSGIDGAAVATVQGDEAVGGDRETLEDEFPWIRSSKERRGWRLGTARFRRLGGGGAGVGVEDRGGEEVGSGRCGVPGTGDGNRDWSTTPPPEGEGVWRAGGTDIGVSLNGSMTGRSLAVISSICSSVPRKSLTSRSVTLWLAWASVLTFAMYSMAQSIPSPDTQVAATQ